MCDDVNDPPALLSSVCEVEFPPPLCAVASPVGSALCSCSSSSYNSLFLDSPSPLLTSNRKQFQIGTFRLAVCLFYIFPFSHKHQIQVWKLLHSLSHTKLLFYGYKTIQIPYINLNKLVKQQCDFILLNKVNKLRISVYSSTSKFFLSVQDLKCSCVIFTKPAFKSTEMKIHRSMQQQTPLNCFNLQPWASWCVSTTI